MSESSFFIVFGVAWLLGMAYGLSAFRLLLRVRRLKAEGRAEEAPDPMANAVEVFGYLGWLLTGRYAEVGDPIVTRWALFARVLFLLAAPAILVLFVLAGSRMIP